jgi:hypothetical protein
MAQLQQVLSGCRLQGAAAAAAARTHTTWHPKQQHIALASVQTAVTPGCSSACVSCGLLLMLLHVWQPFKVL